MILLCIISYSAGNLRKTGKNAITFFWLLLVCYRNRRVLESTRTPFCSLRCPISNEPIPVLNLLRSVNKMQNCRTSHFYYFSNFIPSYLKNACESFQKTSDSVTHSICLLHWKRENRGSNKFFHFSFERRDSLRKRLYANCPIPRPLKTPSRIDRWNSTHEE